MPGLGLVTKDVPMNKGEALSFDSLIESVHQNQRLLAFIMEYVNLIDLLNFLESKQTQNLRATPGTIMV